MSLAHLVKCQRDSYLQQFDTKVLNCEENVDGKKVRSGEKGGYVVQLEDTILFPEGGGQPSDFGSIDGIAIHDVFRTEKGLVLHHMATEPKNGSTVSMTLDWTRRFDHMQQHTAQHLISALFEREYNIKTLSWNLGKDRCTIEFGAELKEFTVDKQKHIENLANEAIRVHTPVTIREISSKEDREALPAQVRSRGFPENVDIIRLVEINGIDMNTCCGTHVRNLSDIQMITFLNSPEKARRGAVRVTFIAGRRVIEAVHTWDSREKQLTLLFKTQASEHVEATKRTQNNLKAALQQNKRLGKELAEFVGKSLAGSEQDFVELHRDGVDMTFLQTVAKFAREDRPKLILFLTCTSTSGNQFLLKGSPELNAKVSKPIKAMLQAKGGGRGDTFQGKCEDLKRRSEVVALLKETLSAT